MVSSRVITTVNNLIKDEGDEECFEACIFNCAYAQDQLESEEKVYSWSKKQEQSGQQHGLQNRAQSSEKSFLLVTVVSDAPSDESSFADDRSLLDDDSSSQNS